MTSNATVQFKEGARHSILITVSSGVTVSNYSAEIQVKDSYDDTAIMTFSTVDGTLTIGSNNTIYWDIPANKSLGLAGSYLWQLMLYTSVTDAVKFDINRMIIEESITI